MFSKKTIDLDKLKVEDPDAYSALMNDAKANVKYDENTELKIAKEELAQYRDKEARIEIDAQIISYGEKLKVPEMAKRTIADKLNFETALKYMVDENIKNVKDIKESFGDTASVAAGENLEEGNEDEPKTFYGAMTMIAERDKCTKAEASVKAQKEFPKLLAKKYGKEEDNQ